jgi:hypothetical protein
MLRLALFVCVSLGLVACAAQDTTVKVSGTTTASVRATVR